LLVVTNAEFVEFFLGVDNRGAVVVEERRMGRWCPPPQPLGAVAAPGS